jgi:hypothetical protein
LRKEISTLRRFDEQVKLIVKIPFVSWCPRGFFSKPPTRRLTAGSPLSHNAPVSRSLTPRSFEGEWLNLTRGQPFG